MGGRLDGGALGAVGHQASLGQRRRQPMPWLVVGAASAEYGDASDVVDAEGAQVRRWTRGAVDTVAEGRDLTAARRGRDSLGRERTEALGEGGTSALATQAIGRTALMS